MIINRSTKFYKFLVKSLTSAKLRMKVTDLPIFKSFSQPAFTCSKLTIEALQGVKNVKS